MFVKPVKGTMSIRAQMVHGKSDLDRALRFGARELFTKLLLLRPYHQLLWEFSDRRVPAHYFIAEAPLAGAQVTVDGFVQNGRATVVGNCSSPPRSSRWIRCTTALPDTCPSPIPA